MPSSSPSLPLDATETPTTTAAPPKKRASKKPTTEKPPPDPRTAVIFHALEELQGYKFDRGSSPRTMKAIRTMLDEGHEPDAIIGCWRKLKAGFWSDKFLELAVVAKYLGEYETGNMARAAPPPYRNGTGPPAATPPRNGTGSGPPPPAKEVTAVFRTASVEEIRARRLAREAQQQGAQSP